MTNSMLNALVLFAIIGIVVYVNIWHRSQWKKRHETIRLDQYDEGKNDKTNIQGLLDGRQVKVYEKYQGKSSFLVVAIKSNVSFDGLFELKYPKKVFSKGFQLGHSRFDNRFTLDGGNEQRIRKIFTPELIRRLLEITDSGTYLEIRDSRFRLYGAGDFRKDTNLYLQKFNTIAKLVEEGIQSTK